jgi:predicted RNA-binding Zn-ribbon protein involved in translation (DUF1610 family)
VTVQQDVFNLADLATISFECLACRSEVILRAGAKREKGQKILCPLCHHELPNAANIFDHYHAMYEAADSLGETVKLRAATQPDPPARKP